MNAVTFDPAKQVTFYFRCNRAGSITFTFVYSDGTPYSFIYTDDLEFNIYKNQGDKKKLISLNYISGLTISGNRVTTSITKDLSNIPEGEYYAELYRTDLEKTWICGDAIFHNGKFDGVEQSNAITVNEGGDTVSITIDTQSPSFIRVYSVASTATLTLNVDSYDAGEITSQAVSLTIANPTGTPTNGMGIYYRVKDNAVQRSISFGDKFRPFSIALPLVTTVSKWVFIPCIYNSTDDKWDVLPYSVEI